MKYDEQQLAAATGGQLSGGAGRGRIVTDTRADVRGAWFLALVGARFDGHDHVAEALTRGAVGAIVHESLPGNHPMVRVADTTRALQDLGRWTRDRFGGPVVGLTGSSGKTTTRALARLALEPLGPVHATEGTLNNHLGVPLTLIGR